MGHPLSCPIPCSSCVSRRKLPWAVSRQLLDAFKEATITPHKPMAVLSHAKSSFFMFRQKCLCFNLCPFRLVLWLGSAEKRMAPQSSVYHQIIIPPLSLCWTIPALSAFPGMWDAPILSSSLWPFSEPSPVTPWVLWTGELRPGHRTPGLDSPQLSRRMCCWSQPLEPCSSASFQSTARSTCPACT